LLAALAPRSDLGVILSDCRAVNWKRLAAMNGERSLFDTPSFGVK